MITDIDYLNDALEASMMTNILAEELGFIPKTPNPTMGGIPVESKLLSKFTGKRTYIQTGHDSYGGAIKGHAALGYYWQYMANDYKELLNIEELSKSDNIYAARLLTEKANYLKEHPKLRDSDGNPYKVDNIPLLYIALWKAFKDRPMVAPSSGSFAYSFVETLSKLREKGILNENEGAVHLHVPVPGKGLISNEKYLAITTRARNVEGCQIIHWEDAKKRDFAAFEDSLGLREGEKNVPGYFAPQIHLAPNKCKTILLHES